MHIHVKFSNNWNKTAAVTLECNSVMFPLYRLGSGPGMPMFFKVFICCHLSLEKHNAITWRKKIVILLIFQLNQMFKPCKSFIFVIRLSVSSRYNTDTENLYILFLNIFTEVRVNYAIDFNFKSKSNLIKSQPFSLEKLTSNIAK